MSDYVEFTPKELKYLKLQPKVTNFYLFERELIDWMKESQEENHYLVLTPSFFEIDYDEVDVLNTG